jgi:hypothetical protein
MPEPTLLELVTADGLYLANIPVEEQTNEICLAACDQNGFAIQFVLLPHTQTMQSAAIAQSPFSIQEIHNPTYTSKLYACQLEGMVLPYLAPLTQELCNTAVQQNKNSFMYVPAEFQAEPMCELAVGFNGMLLEFVAVQTENICVKAVKQNGFALKHVVTQTDLICNHAVLQNINSFRFDTLQLWRRCYKVLKKKGILLEFLIDKSDTKLTFTAVSNDPYAIRFVPEEYQTEGLCMTACDGDGMTLEFVINQTEGICIIACANDGYALTLVEIQTVDICLEAVRQNGMTLEFVINQTEQICIDACTQDGMALRLVTVQTQPIVDAAIAQNPYAAQYALPEFLP